MKDFTFIDLFAGIGGFRLAMQGAGGRCVFSSEIDNYARKTYEANFGEVPFGDIKEINAEDVPDHDVLCAGFPCQPFSVAGGKEGFSDKKGRGNLFFDVLRIAEKKNPKAILLENVSNLEAHDGGRTLKVIVSSLETIGYKVFFKVLNSSKYGLPQNRSRIYIVALKDSQKEGSFNFPDSFDKVVALKDLLDQDVKNVRVVERDDIEIKKEYIPKRNIFEEIELPNKVIRIGQINKGSQGERIYSIYGHAITISTTHTGLYLINGKVRKLSPRECARVQGYPESFRIVVSNTQAYKQFGNSVSIPVVEAMAKQIVKILK